MNERQLPQGIAMSVEEFDAKIAKAVALERERIAELEAGILALSLKYGASSRMETADLLHELAELLKEKT